MLCLLCPIGKLASAETQRASTSSFANLAAQADAARDADQLDRATALYHRALALRPSWKPGWWSLGTILYDQNSYAEAASAFRKLLAQDQKNGTAHLMLGLCEYQLNQDDAALRDIQTARKLGTLKDEQLVHVLHYHEAMLLLRKGRFEGARDALRFLVNERVQSAEVNAALGMAALLIQPKQSPPPGTPEADLLLRVGQAEALGLQDKYDSAAKAYADLVRDAPNFPGIHYAYGRILLAIEDNQHAIAEFKQEISNHPDHARARLQIANAYYRVDSRSGIPYATEAVKLQPAYPFGHYLLGLLYLDVGDATNAIPQLQEASRLVPQEPQFYFALGTAYSKAGRKQDAARARSLFMRLKQRKDADSSYESLEDPQRAKRRGTLPQP